MQRPPPTLLFTAPMAFISADIALPAFAALSMAAIVYAIRRLQLPWILLLWPPLWGSVFVGNPNAMLVALLLLPLGLLAVLAKVYAVFPLLGELRIRQAAASAALLLVTVPILPWGTYIRDYPMIQANLVAHAAHLSAWGTPLVILVAPALILLGRRRAGWLAVPALWPATQLGYHALALPLARCPWLALGLSVPLPLVAPVTIMAYAAFEIRQHRRRQEQADARSSAMLDGCHAGGLPDHPRAEESRGRGEARDAVRGGRMTCRR